jgi:nitroreductase
MSFLSNLNWRYATKKFDTSKKVSEENLEKIIEAIRMTPTSFGLQPYHFYIVTNPDVLSQIQPIAWGQPQITTCSHLIVFAARSDLMANTDEYFTLISSGDSEVRSQMK